jgi:RHS repeat-associated protein
VRAVIICARNDHLKTVSFYNALDQRIGVKDSGTQTWTVYDGQSPDADPYADFDSSGNLTMRYLFGPGVVNGAVTSVILARTSSGGTTAWYLTDKLGSVRDIVSTSGTVLDHLVYDSFGKIVTETNASNGDRFKFALMQYDATTAKYFDHARWYGPVPGRFESLDPSEFGGNDLNLYRFAANSPQNFVDPTGLEFVGGPEAGEKFLQEIAKELKISVKRLTGNKQFAALWDALKTCPEKITLVIDRSLRNAKGVPIAGQWNRTRRRLSINPDALPKNRINRIENYRTLVHEMIHAVLDATLTSRIEFLRGVYDWPHDPFLDKDETWQLIFREPADLGAPIYKDDPAWTESLRKHMDANYDPGRFVVNYTDMNAAGRKLIDQMVLSTFGPGPLPI